MSLVEGNLFTIYASKRGTDRTAHLCSLIGASIFRCLDSMLNIADLYVEFQVSEGLETGQVVMPRFFPSCLVRYPEDRSYAIRIIFC